jgi:hypothetical protein
MLARKTEQKLNYVTLRLPESKGEYPDEWGRDPFPHERGKFSKRFQEWLREDVAAVWPDVDSLEDPGVQSAALRCCLLPSFSVHAYVQGPPGEGKGVTSDSAQSLDWVHSTMTLLHCSPACCDLLFAPTTLFRPHDPLFLAHSSRVTAD